LNRQDIIIIGGGIVGLAAAYNLLQKYPHKRLTLLEKEDRLAYHQTGHSSGVLHSGIYYNPRSLKALTCRAGKKAMEEFCAQEGIGYKLCGKVIVARDDSEAAGLRGIYERGRANGIDCELIGRSRLLELEPHAAGVRAIHIPETGIVNYRRVCERLAARIKEGGHNIINGVRAIGLKEAETEVVVKSTAGDFSAAHVINCAGLHSDRLTSLGGHTSPARIVPFRGEYFKLKPEAEYLCNNLIYPVPDPGFPFLGVHFTRTISGRVKCGPNAVLAFAREGYRKTDVNIRDLFGTLTYPGFLKLVARHWREGLGEMWRSISKAAFVKALQRLVPKISEDHLMPFECGIRAQAVAPDGTMLDDFCFQERPRVINVVNAPSPGATASLSIGRLIVDRLASRL
jgi:L-2-hydroxyglutarate oxidase